MKESHQAFKPTHSEDNPYPTTVPHGKPMVIRVFAFGNIHTGKCLFKKNIEPAHTPAWNMALTPRTIQK